MRQIQSIHLASELKFRENVRHLNNGRRLAFPEPQLFAGFIGDRRTSQSHHLKDEFSKVNVQNG